MTDFTHFNPHGDAQMVDVSHKSVTHRTAVAHGSIDMQPETLAKITAGSHKKGDVLSVARIAAIMAAKKTSELIPLCHPLSLTRIVVKFSVDKELSSVTTEVEVASDGKTGVEMEALTAVQVALLTIYDMCKAVDRGMRMRDIELLKKSGGRSGFWVKPDAQS